MIKFSFISIDIIKKGEFKDPENLFKKEILNENLERWYTMNFIKTNDIKILYGRYKTIYNIIQYVKPKIKNMILPEEHLDNYIRNEFITLVEFSRIQK